MLRHTLHQLTGSQNQVRNTLIRGHSKGVLPPLVKIPTELVLTTILIPVEDTLLPLTTEVIQGSIQILPVAVVFIIPLQDHIHREVTDPPDLQAQGTLLLHVRILLRPIQAVEVAVEVVVVEAAAVTVVAVAATDNLI
jgi:hypothetical protein